MKDNSVLLDFAPCEASKAKSKVAGRHQNSLSMGER